MEYIISLLINCLLHIKVNIMHYLKSQQALKYLYYNYRYLASGDLMSSIQYHYLRGLTTVSDIIKETCGAIWDCLHNLVFTSSVIDHRKLVIKSKRF